MFTSMSEKELRDYLYNPDNAHECDGCPMNQDASEWPGNRLPCGQFRCWVDVHCARLDDDQD